MGPNGTDISHDHGKHWQHSDYLNLNAVSFDGTRGWAVGAKGTIARFKDHYQYLIEWPFDGSVVTGELTDVRNLLKRH